MSRAGLYGSLLAAAAAMALVACAPRVGRTRTRPNVNGPIRITFTCTDPAAGDVVRLAGADGTPAWTVERQGNAPIVWLVDPHLTINSVHAAPGSSLPIDPDGDQGKAPGRAWRSRVRGNVDAGDYRYDIDVTCRQNGTTRRLIIDPEMIVR